MKHNFIKINIASIFVVILFIVSSIYYLDIVMTIATVIFIIILIKNYKKYDWEEQENDEWWNRLSRKDKNDIYRKYFTKTEEEDLK